MRVEPRKEHEWLHRLIGEWTFEVEAPGPEGAPPMKLKAKESVRSLGGLWVVIEGEGDTPDGGTAQTLWTLGYDPDKGRFVGTFVASMMANLWVYEGELDAAGQVLTLHTQGPDMTGAGGTTAYQDIIELGPGDRRVLRSQAQGPDGNWVQFMEAEYRRST